jgi:hypothetical protein
MRASDLIDPVAVRKHISMVHEYAAAAIYGLRHSRPVVIQLCSKAPDDTRFCTSSYCVGDTEQMITDALIDSEAGKNCFIEPRLVRPTKFVNERGGFGDTVAVFALIGDSDSPDRLFTAKLPASALIETSPGNEHRWYFLNRAIGVGDAVELGQLMRNSCGGDGCTGVPTQPFRIAGTPNYPDKRKRARNRVTVPTRLVWSADRTFTVEQLRSYFADSPLPAPRHDQIPNIVAHRPAYCRSRARAILAADPCNDRSAQFMSAMNYAALGGFSIAEIEAIARQHLNGCSGKYADRLTQEIARCYDKITREQRQ